MLCYHGTTITAAKQILKTGFQISKHIWKCSQSNVTYMVAADNNPKNREEAIRFAIEAAQIASAVNNESNVNIALFQFDMPNEIFNELLPDLSCANMDGCYVLENSKLNTYISEHKIKMTAKLVENAYCPFLQPFYLCDCDKELYNVTDKQLLKTIAIVQPTDRSWFYDDVLYIDINFEEMPNLTERIDTR